MTIIIHAPQHITLLYHIIKQSFKYLSFSHKELLHSILPTFPLNIDLPNTTAGFQHESFHINNMTSSHHFCTSTLSRANELLSHTMDCVVANITVFPLQPIQAEISPFGGQRLDIATENWSVSKWPQKKLFESSWSELCSWYYVGHRYNIVIVMMMTCNDDNDDDGDMTAILIIMFWSQLYGDDKQIPL